ncbi:MAG TPA: phosphatidylglycerophosphatase A [Candidatus Acidoferrales bacterium]|nr:phosphatidylglycerophosphatase A [Candidatus Acidoferrales bacterium]
MNAGENSASHEVSRGRKPRISLFIATACGLGYLPKAPGTWGSLAGVLVYFLIQKLLAGTLPSNWISVGSFNIQIWLSVAIVVAIALAIVGVWTSHRVARYSAAKDPQFVVIDEVSGQMFTYVLALAPANWKYLLLGLILFRVFDIWKPFPARQAESLPGGWGIMTDDWIAGIYAAVGLWLARAAGF